VKDVRTIEFKHRVGASKVFLAHGAAPLLLSGGSSSRSPAAPASVAARQLAVIYGREGSARRLNVSTAVAAGRRCACSKRPQRPRGPRSGFDPARTVLFKHGVFSRQPRQFLHRGPRVGLPLRRRCLCQPLASPAPARCGTVMHHAEGQRAPKRGRHFDAAAVIQIHQSKDDDNKGVEDVLRAPNVGCWREPPALPLVIVISFPVD
jgi:hypothetical protein